MTIVYVTHDPRMAEFAEQLIELRDGKILETGVYRGGVSVG